MKKIVAWFFIFYCMYFGACAGVWVGERITKKVDKLFPPSTE